MDNKEIFEEWYFQSDYDLETAFDMFRSGRMVYCIFMCHLSLEKALKGLLLNKISVPTRYPDDLRKLSQSYSEERTLAILNQTKEVQEWIKKQ